MKINNKEVFKNIQAYLNLDIYGKKVVCPYSINFVENEFLGLMRMVGIEEEKIKEVHELYKSNEAIYGWYRGKGTAKEISSATKEIAKKRNFNLESSSPEGIVEFMRLVDLGIDCSKGNGEKNTNCPIESVCKGILKKPTDNKGKFYSMKRIGREFKSWKG